MQLSFDPQKYQYPSTRRVVYGRRGMVCTTQPLAAQAGLDMIKQGGNAVDAAVATAIAMTVLEPTSNGIGSDAFALVFTKDGHMSGLNGSGPAPALATVSEFRSRNLEEVPPYGLLPVTVSGAPSTWSELSAKYGRLPFEKLFEPAISYAEEGFPVQSATAHFWNRAYRLYRDKLTGEEFKGWFDTFAPNGQVPPPGGLFRSPDHGKTLRELAATHCESFYRGAIADQIDAFSRRYDGLIRKEDLAAFRAEWVTPIHTNYRGYDVWEMPPNGHGITALMALNIVEGFDFTVRDHVDTFHRQMEAMKLAFSDGKRYIADPAAMEVSCEQLLSKDYAASRRALIGSEALLPEAGNPNCGGTIYLCTADGEGNMVSYIQSNFRGFGSGIVIPGTGISLQDRGNQFTLNETSPNCLSPGKRPYHTIIPGFLSKDGQAIGPFGVMGGMMQPQGHLQVIMNTIDFHLNPQQALDAPRWQWMSGREIQVERSFPWHIAEELTRRGHKITMAADSTPFGRGEIIWRDENGVLLGATECRADGYAAAW